MGDRGGSVKVTRKLPWLLVLLVTLLLALVAAGCGGDDDDGEDAGSGDTSAATDDATTEEAEPIRVGLVTDIGGLNDRGFNSLANEGLERAASELDAEIRVLESKSDADYIPNLSTLAEEGFDLVISVGFLMGEATHTAAEEFPDTKFAIIDNAYGDPPDCEAEGQLCNLDNLQGLLFKEQETGYLAGYLAGLVTETNTISSVGGIKIPPVDRFIAGYQAGAKASNPDITTLNAYSEDFVDQAKCKEVALDQIAEGSDVVFQVAGGCGLGALDAAQQEGVWGIGVDADQAFLGEHVLTSALKRVDEAVFQTIQAVADGSFTGGGVTLFGLAEDGVGLGEFSPNAPQEAIDEALAQVDGIISGEIEVPDALE
jgi:basic membrane protein A